MEIANYIGAGLAVGLAGIGVAIGQGILAKTAVRVMGKRKEMTSFFLTITILGIALVESAVIYGLIVAFQILDIENLSLVASIGAGLAVGLAGMGAGIGEGKLISGAINAIDRKPELKGKIMTLMVLFIALVESAAIYGLVISFKILGADDNISTALAGELIGAKDNLAFLGMGLAIGLAGLGVSIGEGILAESSMEAIGKKDDMTGFFLTVTILGIALVESAAIYGLIIAFQISSAESISLTAGIGAGLAIGLAGLGAGIGEGKLIGGAIRAMEYNPEMKGKIMTLMVLFIALVESAAIYGLVVSFKILGADDYSIMGFVGMGLSIGLAGLGVSIGEGILAERSMEAIGRKPKMSGFFLTVTILGIALVESAAIYGLIIAFQIAGTEGITVTAGIGAGLAIGLAGLGAGIGEGKLVGGAIRAMENNPELKGKIMTLMVLFIALVESAAIYGLVVSFKILGADDYTAMGFVGMGLSIGLAGLGVSIGEGMLAENSMEAIGKKAKMMGFFLTVSILGIALVESAAIYGLISAFQIGDKEGISLSGGIGAGLAIGLAGLGAGIGEGKLVGGAIRAMESNPELKGKIMTLMVLFIALVESAAIYGLVISFKILGVDEYSSMGFVGMGLSIGLAGLGVSIGEGILAERSMTAIGRNVKMMGFFLTITILGVALVESAAIYGLVVAFDIFNRDLPLYAGVGAGLAIGLAGLGAGIGEGILVSGSIGAIARNPQNKGKILTLMVLFVALVEVTAIYGLIIAFKIAPINGVDNMIYMGAGLAIGLAGLGVGIGRGYLSEGSIEVMGRNPKTISFLLTISILGVALVESAAIYGLIVAFQILGAGGLSGMAGVGAGLAIGLTGLGAGYGEGLLIKGAVDGMNIATESRGKILTFMVLFIALIEVVAIYGMIIAFKVIG